jgi:glycosyltransferase involved in cell wall biosynthesis
VKVLIIGPTAFPYLDHDLYGGIEMLAGLFARELSNNHFVVIAAPNGSQLPPSVSQITIPTEWHSIKGEHEAYKVFGKSMSQFDIVLDFTHNHYAIRTQPDIPHISMIWHDPNIMKTPTPVNNVVALSNWQAKRFTESMEQGIRVLDSICNDPEVYSYDESVKVSDRYIALGIVDARKGHLMAAELALEMDVPLDVVGPPHDRAYAWDIEAFIRKNPRAGIVYHGEVNAKEKLRLLREAKGLLYPVNFPEGMGESHSMKMAEALMLGTPCITWNQGAMKEIFNEVALVADSIPSMTDGIIGFSITPINSVRKEVSILAHDMFASDKVVNKWLPTMDAVAGGEIW